MAVCLHFQGLHFIHGPRQLASHSRDRRTVPCPEWYQSQEHTQSTRLIMEGSDCKRYRTTCCREQHTVLFRFRDWKSVGMPSSPSDSTINLPLTTKESKPQWRDCHPCLSKTPGGLATVASSSSPDECSHSIIPQEHKKSDSDRRRHLKLSKCYFDGL